MSITNISKPSTSLTNASKVFDYDTWTSIQTTWATETRTWAETISTMDNQTKVSASITNVNKP